MRNRLVIQGCLGLLFLGTVSAWGAGGPPPGQPDTTAAALAAGSAFKGAGVAAYYFHVNVRCQTCLAIEQRSGEVIKGSFGKELQDGVLAWNVVNTQQPANRRFVNEYQLPSRGLVLVSFRDGKPGRWKNLEDVWKYIHGDPAVFQQYVSREVRDFLDLKP